MIKRLKQLYWQTSWRWQRFWHPASISLSPHDWMDAVGWHTAAHGGRLVMVDVGSHDGQTALRFRQRLGNLEVHAFEPNPRLFGKLQANLALVPGSRHNVAVGESSGTIRMIFNNFPMTSSPLRPSAYSRKYFENVTRPEHEAEVPAITLDRWWLESGRPKVHILKIDVQGYEDRVLRGAGQLLDSGIDCVFLEVNFIPFYEGSALFADVDQILRAYGYRLFNLYNLCTHLPENQIGSGDALYVPDRGRQVMTRRQAA